MRNKIVLASQSPRRKQLLEWAEISFDIMARHTDEHYPPDLPVAEVPSYIARSKALALAEDPSFLHFEKEATIIAADTVVILDHSIIGKPEDRADAISMLTRLSGKEHLVITGVCILKGSQEITFAETTRVTFHTLTTAQIEYYVDNYKPYDKAGSYAIQEWIGVVGIEKIEGDFYNVMGLPISKVLQQLRLLGL
jgi:septum formation protein